jgi:hypothetical protein
MQRNNTRKMQTQSYVGLLQSTARMLHHRALALPSKHIKQLLTSAIYFNRTWRGS